MMSGTPEDLGGSNNQPPTMLENLRSARRRVAELEAELASAHANADCLQQELCIERSNAESLQRALDSLQVSITLAFVFPGYADLRLGVA